jgi:hypothetical protein
MAGWLYELWFLPSLLCGVLCGRARVICLTRARNTDYMRDERGANLGFPLNFAVFRLKKYQKRLRVCVAPYRRGRKKKD